MHGLYTKRFYFLAAIIFFVVYYSVSALATEVILDDGSVIELVPGEKIYISTAPNLYAKSEKSGSLSFTPAEALEVPVVEEPEPPKCSKDEIDACEFGSVEYCTYFSDAWDGTVTFESVNFQKACDTNEDGEYTFCLDYEPYQEGFTFTDQYFVRYCSEDPNFNPVQGR